ncbi:GFA family protein [Methylogaea oryzae]|uniref:Aldehyde-activating protein n=1 Tax=Methylogaea oryzae TaxID=1295382 RepID=A0A8D4VQR9_9GAMM|nr:GFA family protein [Methylogaea oryzae]BBL71992.1 aldehyde-activating protein [Methylogaea oryzae]
MIYQGGCHCGAIRFEVDAPEAVEVEDCNCSICRMTGFLHLIVPKSKFLLLSGEDAIATYRFNTGVAQHTFCKVCGIKPFYIPRSNPDGVDVNLRCLMSPPESVKVVDFDGENWELNAQRLAHKSQ